MVTQTSRQKLYRQTLVLAAAVAAAAVASMASAATPAAKVEYSSDRVPSIVVRYDDLNLSTEQGSRQLYTRIKSAAQKVCPVALSRNLSSISSSERCQSEAIDRAVAVVN